MLLKVSLPPGGTCSHLKKLTRWSLRRGTTIFVAPSGVLPLASVISRFYCEFNSFAAYAWMCGYAEFDVFLPSLIRI